jgi:hypothetical protein
VPNRVECQSAKCQTESSARVPSATRFSSARVPNCGTWHSLSKWQASASWLRYSGQTAEPVDDFLPGCGSPRAPVRRQCARVPQPSRCLSRSVPIFHRLGKIRNEQRGKCLVDPNCAACSNTVLGQPVPVTYPRVKSLKPIMPHSLESYVGRSAVFIESSEACLVTVEKVECDAERVRADFKLVPHSFRCRLRFIRTLDDDPIEAVLQEPPSGESWNVMVRNKEFFLENDHWQASFLWGGGFRVFFQPSFVSRFLDGDVRWLDEYYNDSEDEDDGGSSQGTMPPDE